jgi:hypothetical protein
MRFTEIAPSAKTLKPIKPMTPPQLRVRSLKVNVQRSKDALTAEREQQRRQREAELQRKSRQQQAKLAA